MPCYCYFSLRYESREQKKIRTRRPAILQRKRCFSSNGEKANVELVPKALIITTHNNIHSSIENFDRLIVVQSAESHFMFDPGDGQERSLKDDEVKKEIIIDTEDEILKKDSSRGAYECDSCDEEFIDRSALIIHKTEKSIIRTRAAIRDPIVKYTCEICSRAFITKSRYDRHYRNCGIVETDSEVVNYRRRKRHNPSQSKRLKNNGEDEPSACTKCEKVFKKDKYLKVHMTTAHGEHIICQICDMKLDTIALLKNHMVEVHSGDFTEHCKICNKGFYLRQSLKVHMAAHQRDDKLSSCSICGKKFRHEVYLRKHIDLVHSKPDDRQRFSCDKCDYQTDYKTCYREHMYKHTGEDIIGCEVCGKQMRRGYLKIHSRIHTGERPEICEYCGKTFSARKYLTKHRITHTGEKPHECAKCGKTYTQRGTLTMHLKKHHPQEAKEWIAKGPGRKPQMRKKVESRRMIIGEDGMSVEVENKVSCKEDIKEVIDEEGKGEEFIGVEEDIIKKIDDGDDVNEQCEFENVKILERDLIKNEQIDEGS